MGGRLSARLIGHTLYPELVESTSFEGKVEAWLRCLCADVGDADESFIDIDLWMQYVAGQLRHDIVAVIHPEASINIMERVGGSDC